MRLRRPVDAGELRKSTQKLNPNLSFNCFSANSNCCWSCWYFCVALPWKTMSSRTWLVEKSSSSLHLSESSTCLHKTIRPYLPFGKGGIPHLPKFVAKVFQKNGDHPPTFSGVFVRKFNLPIFGRKNCTQQTHHSESSAKKHQLLRQRINLLSMNLKPWIHQGFLDAQAAPRCLGGFTHRWKRGNLWISMFFFGGFLVGGFLVGLWFTYSILN